MYGKSLGTFVGVTVNKYPYKVYFKNEFPLKKKQQIIEFVYTWIYYT